MSDFHVGLGDGATHLWFASLDMQPMDTYPNDAPGYGLPVPNLGGWHLRD